MRLVLIMLVLATTLDLSRPALAQSRGRSSIQPVSSAAAPADSSIALTAAKRELAISEKSQDRLLATVHWSLGLVGTVAVLLVGFGWFVNFRVYERDKAALEATVQAAVVQASTEAADALRSDNRGHQESLRRDYEALRAEITAHLAEFRKGQEAIATKAAEDALSETKLALGRMSTQLDALKVAEKQAKLRDLAIDVELWTIKKGHGSVILSGLRWVELALELKESDMMVAVMLERISDAFDKGGNAGPWIAPDLHRVLTKLPPVQESYRDRIAAHLKDKG